jgi:hypothetical protein
MTPAWTQRLTVLNGAWIARAATPALLAILALVALHAVYFLAIGLSRPISDMHEFRQTQTALSAYWIWREGHFLAYETPVVGYPWSIPFEFPTYEDLVAALRAIGVPIVVGGRLISFAFLIGLLWPLAILCDALRLGRTTYLVIAILLLASPIHVFWGRTLMIETCAVFFGLAWLAFLARFLERRHARDAVFALLAGILATLTKSTTFPPFGLLGGALFCWTVFLDVRAGLNAARIGTLVLAACAGIVPLAVGLLWVWFSDHVKQANPIGALLTSSALHGWTFGTLQQRLSYQLWHDVIWRRAMRDILGGVAVAAPLLVFAAALNRRILGLAIACVAAFLLPFLLLTNLHIIHNYYQTANAIFLLAAVGLGIAAIAERGGKLLGIVVLLVVVVGQIRYFRDNFAHVVTVDQSGAPAIRIGAAIQRLTRPGEAIVVIGDDWSSAIPFYGERKALALPFFTPAAMAAKLLDDPARSLGGDTLGAVVYCPAMVANYNDGQTAVRHFVAGRALLADVAGCQILAAAGDVEHRVVRGVSEP